MKALLLFIVVALLLLLAKTSTAQSGRLTFHHVPSPKGAISTAAVTIVQDPQGYIWIGNYGLHRYDGYRYTSYYNNPLNPNSLSDNRIEAVCASRNGTIWVSAFGYGLDRLDPATGHFAHFRHNPKDPNSLSTDTITAIIEDRKGIIWIGSHNGLNRFDPKTKTVKRFQHNPADPNTLSSNQVRALYEDRQGTIWVGCGSIWNEENAMKKGGLNRLDQEKGTFTRYIHDPANPQSLIDNRIRSIFEDSRGTFWVGTAGDGLHTMNREKGTFERHTYNPAHPEKLSRPPLRNIFPWAVDHVTFITEDLTGAIWIGSMTNGINRYDPETKKVTHFPNFKDSVSGVQTNAIGGAACISREGVLWVGYWEGLFRVDPLQKNIPYFTTGGQVYSIYEDTAAMLWYATPGGLKKKNRRTGTEKQFVSDPGDAQTISNNRINAIYEDRQGTLWIGTDRGLNHFDRNTGAFARYRSYGVEDSSLKGGIITAICENRQGSLLIGIGGAGGGVFLMNPQKGIRKHYRNDPKDSNSLSNNIIRCIYEDRSGNVWIGTYLGGLNRLPPQMDKFQRFLYGVWISTIVQDSDGILWLGTSNGLYRSNAAMNAFSRFTGPNAEFGGSLFVNGLLEDNQKALWVNTSDGIYRLDPQRKEVRLFGRHKGLFDYRSVGCYKAKSGELFFSGPNGYYAFYPEHLTDNTRPPEIALSAFRVGDHTIIPGGESPLQQPLWLTKQIHLDHDQNVFSFDFAGIHFSNPEANQHLFMLEGLDNGWRKAGEEKTAYYYNVPPGHYAFHVKAANSDGIWAEKSIGVIVLPPWWRTWWAYTLYGLLFLGAILAVHNYQHKRLIQKEREKTRARELAQAKEIEKAYAELKATQAYLIQREKLASLGELTAGIAHEIQNPLNFVNNFSEVNLELIEELNKTANESEEIRALAANLKDNEQKIHQHGKRAASIVKSMMEHSRSNTGEKGPTDLNALVNEYLRLAYHGMRIKDKTFNAKVESQLDPHLGEIYINTQDISRVLLNLFNNAFYSVNEKKRQLNQSNKPYQPTVTVSTKKIDGKAEITVQDNGLGIPDKIINKIFQPFFTTKPTGQGTGLGLSLSYDIITKEHGGELTVETKEGEYARFFIRLPLHPTPNPLPAPTRNP